MRILVTGGKGMVGNYINNIVSNQYKNHTFIFLSRSDCDLISREAVIQYFNKKDIDYIIHLAASVGGLYKNMDNNIKMFSDNIKINENVLEACHLNNIRRGIFCLSSCVYPANPSKFPMDETMIHESPPHSSNEGYSYAKRMLEMQTRHYNKKYGYEFICVTPVNLYGKYDNFNLRDGHFIPMIMHRFYKELSYRHYNPGGNFEAFGTGTPLRQFLYAGDFANIILKLLFDYNGSERNIICSSNNEWKIKDIVYKLADVMKIPREEVKWLTEMSDGCMRKTVTNKKLKYIFNDFNFTNIDEGLEITYNWFKENYKITRK
jgi:GDP-L-fucose synthase